MVFRIAPVPMNISASDKERKILCDLISGACKHVEHKHVLSSCNAKSMFVGEEMITMDIGPDVDIIETSQVNAHIIVRKYLQLLNLYSIPGLNPLIPMLEYTWKSGHMFYIKTVSIPDGVYLSDIEGSLTVLQLMLIMGDICFAMAASHSFDVAHTYLTEKSIVLAPDLSRMKITDYGVLGHTMPFNEGYLRDLLGIERTLTALATRKFIDITEGLQLIRNGKLTQAGRLLRHMAVQGIHNERQIFENWIHGVHSQLLSSAHIQAAPIDCTSSLTILKDMHIRVSYILSTQDEDRNIYQLPMFYPKGSVARGLGPSTLVISSYFNAVMAFGGLTTISQCAGLWPNGNVFKEVKLHIRQRVHPQFFEVIGYIIGYALSVGIRIHHPLSSCVVCLTMCENNEYKSMDTMPEVYRYMATLCASEIASMRRGFEPFRRIIRGNTWSVQQIYTFFFETQPGTTLREHPEAITFRDLSMNEIYCIREELNKLNSQESQRFIEYVTCSPVMPSATDPIIITRGSNEGISEDVEYSSTCARTITLPHTFVINQENIKALLASQIDINYFNCT